jgi:hypothetical protein
LMNWLHHYYLMMLHTLFELGAPSSYLFSSGSQFSARL